MSQRIVSVEPSTLNHHGVVMGYKRKGYNINASLHTLFSTQSLSMTLLSSLIARRWVGAQTQ